MPRGRGGRHRRDPERRLVQRVDGVRPLPAPRALVGLLHRSDVNDLPVAERWFRSQRVTEDDRCCSSRITSTRSSSRTCGTCAGRDRDLVVDTGNGIGDLRAELAPLVERSTDRGRRHARSLRPHRRDARVRGALVPRGRRRRDPRTRRARAAAARTSGPGSRTRSAGTATSRPSVVITALPERRLRRRRLADAHHGADARPRGRRRRGPGRSRLRGPARPGAHRGVDRALGRRPRGLLFTGDTAALDDPLYAEDEDAFVASLERLRALPVELVCAGHSRPFGREELRALIDEQLDARG